MAFELAAGGRGLPDSVSKRTSSKSRGASEFDPFVWSGRASQEFFVDLADARSCINVSGL